MNNEQALDVLHEWANIGKIKSNAHTSEIMDAYVQLYSFIKEKTPADKIRDMTDEELAKFLSNFKSTFGEEYKNEKSCLEWLNKTSKNVTEREEELLDIVEELCTYICSMPNGCEYCNFGRFEKCEVLDLIEKRRCEQ